MPNAHVSAVLCLRLCQGSPVVCNATLGPVCDAFVQFSVQPQRQWHVHRDMGAAHPPIHPAGALPSCPERCSCGAQCIGQGVQENGCNAG